MQNFTKTKLLRLPIAVTAVAGIAVASFLVFSTVHLNSLSRRSTDRAAASVSRLYLSELAGRREQVVSSNLERYFGSMKAALSVIDRRDLADIGSLRAYLQKIKTLYNVDMFVLVDESLTMYRVHSTEPLPQHYSFAGHPAEKYIYTFNADDGSGRKQVVLAMPVEGLSFGGKRISACLMEIDIKEMLADISLQTGVNDNTFCNVYTTDGSSLTDIVLGGLSADSNLFTALQAADMDGGFSLDGVREDFARHQSGFISFTYKNTSESLYYTPVAGTDWLLTYLVRSDIVAEQISDVNDEIARRGFLQLLLTVLVMLAVVAAGILQQRRLYRLMERNRHLEEMRAEIARRESESISILHQMLKSGPWQMDFDEQGKMIRVTWSPTFRRMLGYTDERDFPDRLESWSDLLHQEDKERVLAAYNAAIEDTTGSRGYDVEYRLLTKSGQWRWFHAVGKLSRRLDGSPVTYFGMFIDITERKALEQELSDKQASLEVALKEAQYANEAKTVFLSNMSHDIRTPMNAIIGFTNLALKNPADGNKTAEYLAKIQVSSNHLLSLINDVLEMSRIESGKIELDEQPCSLPEILHDLNTIIIAQVEAKQQELHMDALNVSDENILCDRLRLNQVLLNLLSNAVKYTPNGGKISVRIAQRGEAVDGQADYELRVKDNGIGMSEEFAQHIFEAFTQEKTSTVSGIQGTGLGMAITKKIVDMMGGTITVQTEQGAGTEFIVGMRFRLPGAASLQEKIVELTNIRALVVDDDFDTCDSTTKMLSKMGMRPEWTLSGKEAVLRARQAKEMGDPFGVFIIDLRLDDLNGIEVTRRISKDMGKDTPILLMTAYDWPAIKDEAEAAGVHAFCNKPLFMSELHRSLERVIGSSAGGSGRTAAAEKEEGKAADRPAQEAQFTGKRLLLVDDMDVNREIAAAVLEMHGFTVEQAIDGKQAVEMVEKHPAGYYSAVLMDIQMPVMNGYEATGAIRALADRGKAAVPIIAMTANAFEEDRKNAIAAGMNAHIAKPIDEKKLTAVLGELVGK